MDKMHEPQQEIMDLPLDLYGWDDDKENYRIIAELMPRTVNTAELINILDEVNQLLVEKKLPEIFDGTIDSLRYFIDNHGLDIGKISNPLLREVVQKHLFKPELSREFKMNSNRWSGQALRCKAVLIGLYVQNRKMTVTKGSLEGLISLNEFDFPVFDNDIENGHISDASVKKLTELNATWNVISKVNPWSKQKTRRIDQFIIENMMHSFIPGSNFNVLCDKLQPHMQMIAESYFPGFHETDHRACVAVRHALTIVLYRTGDNIPKGAPRHPEYRVDGFINKWLEYVFTDAFELQDWFVTYVTTEMEKRIKFLKMLADAQIYVEFDEQVENLLKQIWGDRYRPPIKQSLYYLPVFESFRFVPPSSVPLFGRLVTIFHDRNIDTSEKEEMAKTMVYNIQKLVSYSINSCKTHDFEDSLYLQDKKIKDCLMTLLLSILTPIAHSVGKSKYSYFKSQKGEFEDLKQIVTTELLSSILKYDSTKNNSFFGYIHKVLPLSVWTAIRPKSVQTSGTIENAEEMSLDAIAGSNIDTIVQIDELQEKVAKCLDDLPEKEKEAIQSVFFKNERLNDTQRKAKNRALHRLRTLYPELKYLID